ncbi:MAG: hypothetical protein H6819_06765 [Phycisphaerales bacterium]|nr:hypothetical protein [Phycisphaerales bacterium]MCB9855283.1 hypothetical protein [Phycisphaerales bacterium]MCB9862876.1 hypothetical protein [Phycisphaerales bacterium]
MASATKQPSELATRIADLLRRANATAPERAITDRIIADRVHCPVRSVVELVVELAAIDIAVLASCGTKNGGRLGKGRYIETNPAAVLAYSKALHSRAKSIHMRAKHYRDLARRMEENQAVDSRGQRRLFA